ncbi:hypothetical protein MAM1_0199d07818 [Mucor ambiguus]|uniref:Uncharacterized protein n=1 Tax=Mucor ambiguus TaxID=91626 RepID=A0A0C9MLC5_9FUNG|nr:hypothetical protein MAM1_0199d07818 [Mucor ambiguus]
MKKRIIKALKVYQHFFEEKRISLSEDEFLYLLIRPLLKIVFKDVQDITIIWYLQAEKREHAHDLLISHYSGEKSLECAAKRMNDENPAPTST